MTESKLRLKSADIIVGIPSLNEADNIGFVTKRVDRGLRRYFSKYRTAIINADNHSADNTKAAFLTVKTATPKIYISTPRGVKGKGNNLHNLFKIAAKLKARAIAVVDADLKSISEEWIKLLLRPIFDKYDFLTPIYSRNEYDGTITNHICYPMIYGLLGADLRQPIGGDFSFSHNYLDRILKERMAKPVKQYGIDIFMTMLALLHDFRIGQINLGTKIHKPSAPKLGPMFSQVAATLFSMLLAHQEKWLKNGTGRKKAETWQVPILNPNQELGPQPLSIDYKGMKATALWEFKAYEELLKRALSPGVYQEISKMYSRGQLAIDHKLWCKIMYDILGSYNADAGPSLIEALKPLYFGRVVSFIRKTLDLDYLQSEQKIRRQARYFWLERNYLFRKLRNRQNGN